MFSGHSDQLQYVLLNNTKIGCTLSPILLSEECFSSCYFQIGQASVGLLLIMKLIMLCTLYRTVQIT